MKSFLFVKLFLFSCLLHTTYTNAQNNYLEVLSSDKITLKPQSFVYQITFGETPNFMGFSTTNDADNISSNETTTTTLTIQNLEILLQQEQLSYKIIQHFDYAISSSPAPTIFQINFSSEKDLIKMYNLLKTQKGFSAKILEINYENEQMYYQSLYENLYQKALLQANSFAETTQKKVGKLICATEKKDDNTGFMDSYLQMLKNMPMNGLFGNFSMLTKTIEKNIYFKFQLK